MIGCMHLRLQVVGQCSAVEGSAQHRLHGMQCGQVHSLHVCTMCLRSWCLIEDLFSLMFSLFLDRG